MHDITVHRSCHSSLSGKHITANIATAVAQLPVKTDSVSILIHSSNSGVVRPLRGCLQLPLTCVLGDPIISEQLQLRQFTPDMNASPLAFLGTT